MLKGKVLVAQAGGPTAVINQSLVGVILEARKHPEIESVYGARFGVRGIVKEDFIDLSNMPVDVLERIAQTPGSALGSTRDKPDEEYCIKMFEAMKKNNIRYFFYIGGNDTSASASIVNDQAKKAGYELRVFHIPKTIDNDLVLNDHCPGFGSAATFIARAFVGVNLDNASLPGVYIAIVMGRHAGFLTASSIMAKKYPDDGPHLIYLPERSFSKEKFVQDVQNVYNMYGRCVVAVSEGIVDNEGIPIATRLQKEIDRDAHGNVQLSGSGALGELLTDVLKANTDIKRIRVDTFGYLQRSFLGCVSLTDQKEAREVGQKAVEFSVQEDVDGSIIIKRTGDYSIQYELAPLADVAGKTKVMSDEFIAGDNMVSDAFRDYVRPLMGEMSEVERIL